MKKLETITPEQEALIPIVRKEWEDLFYKSRGIIDKPLFEKQIAWLYKTCLQKEAPYIWYCESPLMCQLVINILNLGDNLRDNLGDNLGDNLWDNLGANLWDNLGDNLKANLWDNLGANLRANLWANLWANLRDNLRANLWANLGANLRDNLRDNLRTNLWANLGANLRTNLKLDYNPPSFWGNISDYGWVAFYDYIQKLNYFEYDYDDFNNFKALLRSKVYDFIAFPSVVFVSSCPFEVHQETNKRLHNTEGPAIRFKDGYDVYAIHGRILPSWIWEKKDTITKEMFIGEKNSEIRAAMYSILGEKRVMDILGVIEIDKKLVQHQNDEIEVIKLFKTKELVQITDNLANYLAWVKFTCPSTGTDYLIACEPHYTDAKEAAASLSIFKKEEYSFNFRT